MMMAAGGLKVDADNKILKLTPYKDGITLPLCTSTHLGTVQFVGGERLIPLSEGSLDAWQCRQGTIQ